VLGCVLLAFFLAQHESNLHPEFDPDAHERGLYGPSGGGGAYGGGGNNEGPSGGVATDVGTVGGAAGGVPLLWAGPP